MYLDIRVYRPKHRLSNILFKKKYVSNVCCQRLAKLYSVYVALMYQ